MDAPAENHATAYRDAVIEKLRAEGRLKALPIASIDRQRLTLYSREGIELREYASNGSWVPVGSLDDGAIRYLGSASHAGHIELKALHVLVEGQWHNIVTGATEPHEGSPAAPEGRTGKEGSHG